MSWYIDSSAILKLLIAEKESASLTGFIDVTLKSSVLTRVEVIRSLHRIGSEKIPEAIVILASLDLTPLNPFIIDIAENFAPSITLKSLDAIHVASTIFLNTTVQGLITYDKQMIANAKMLGVRVVSPGMKS